MTIDKAIKRLKNLAIHHHDDRFHDDEEAINMGIAALGQFVFLRKAFPLFKLHELPGETPEETEASHET